MAYPIENGAERHASESSNALTRRGAAAAKAKKKAELGSEAIITPHTTSGVHRRRAEHTYGCELCEA